MANRMPRRGTDRFEPITNDAEWQAKGWSTEPEPMTAARQLEASVAIRLGPDDAELVRRAARLSGLTRSEFVRRAAVRAAADVVERTEAANAV